MIKNRENKDEMKAEIESAANKKKFLDANKYKVFDRK